MKTLPKALYRHLYLLCALALLACTRDLPNAFESSPAERTQSAGQSLRGTLKDAPHGWRVTYFSHVDSLLYTDMQASVPRQLVSLRGRLGYGGYSYLMRFAEDGTLQMRSDEEQGDEGSSRRSSYAIAMGSNLQLSFTTYSYLHRLINNEFLGSADFLYMGNDWRGGLRFTSPSHSEPARDYMLMEALESKEAWQRGLERAISNRRLFESMTNPQIRIHRGDREYFRSDMPSRVRSESNTAYTQELERKRYIFFRMIVRPNPDPLGVPLQIAGIGSGYVGTEEGLSFRPGFRIDDKHFFIDFERKGDRFEAELVTVYDAQTRITHIESKHLYPEGIPTGLTAVIWDDVP